jgi:hypothetical protein
VQPQAFRGVAQPVVARPHIAVLLPNTSGCRCLRPRRSARAKNLAVSRGSFARHNRPPPSNRSSSAWTCPCTQSCSVTIRPCSRTTSTLFHSPMVPSSLGLHLMCQKSNKIVRSRTGSSSTAAGAASYVQDKRGVVAHLPRKAQLIDTRVIKRRGLGCAVKKM